MASLTPTQHRHAQIIASLSAHPSLAQQVLGRLSLPSKPPDYHPVRLEVYFNSQLVLIRERGRVLYQEGGFGPSYRPRDLSIYADTELLFVRAENLVLLNLLPQQFVQEWAYDF